MMHARLRLIDQQRAARFLLAWIDDDKPALDVVLDETARDPGAGTPGLLFALASITGETAIALAGDDAQRQIRAALLCMAADEGGDAGEA